MAYQSEAALEQQFIDQLNKQGYTSVSIPDYDALVENFKAQFETFNSAKLDRPLTDKEWERVMNIMLGKSVFQSAKILRDKFVLEREDGTKVYLSFFDADHTKNIFQVTNQTTVVGKYVNRYDVTILVNGLPLIQVELKRRGIDIREAVNQVMRYKKHSYNGLYHFIQLFVVSNGVDTKYFANSDRDMLHSLAFFWTDFNNVRITNLKEFSISFLARDHIIKMLTRYTILNDTDKLLMVMRPYQVYAVEALVRQATLTNRNAYVWHTTGAGKTLTSFKTAQILAANPNIKKVIFLVDRKDLDSQTTEEFNKFENGSVDATDRTDVLVKQMQDKKEEWERSRENSQCTVTENDIAEVVNAWTGIPVKQLTEDESEKLLHLEEALHKRVVGQDEAISAVSRAIRRARAGLKDPKRPIGSYIFLGPTGVGKTELSKALAEVMFADEDAMIRLDMSEYMEPHSVSKLMGSPPGYVGYDDGGQLTERVRRKPYCVILLDEIEKAHPDVFNTLLQVLEDGRLTDSKGRTVDFRNTIIIMTSNVGANRVGKARAIGFGAESPALTYERMREGMLEELKRTFRPEFLNRVDEIIIFHQLEQDQTLQIVNMMLRGVVERLRERGIDLTVSPEAAAHLASDGFDPVYGARPLRRAIQHQVEDSLSEEVLSGRIRLGDRVECYLDDGKLAFRKVSE